MAARTPGNGNRFLVRPRTLFEGSRTEVEEPPEDGNRFPGRPRTLLEPEPQGERTQQELPQMNMDGLDQGGGGGNRTQIRYNNITAGELSENVGMSNFRNVQGQGGGQGGDLDISGNTITAGGGASNVGFHNFGNSTPDRKCCILM
ncbi:uncharacterized protein LOC110755530 [Prunus avium]|uniref:Uncharacterized protein LOC110755530 n=1 Tax=Prunus avium TaxID=42229 RepID=A0A6P5SFV9_PRUAV|nr:uncharacterized protein LOC110755530 [Prunus avium]